MTINFCLQEKNFPRRGSGLLLSGSWGVHDSVDRTTLRPWTFPGAWLKGTLHLYKSDRQNPGETIKPLESGSCFKRLEINRNNLIITHILHIWDLIRHWWELWFMGSDILCIAQPPSFWEVYSFIGNMLHFGGKKDSFSIFSLGNKKPLASSIKLWKIKFFPNDVPESTQMGTVPRSTPGNAVK